MEKLGLPIAFAAALHGALLFGFNHKSPKAPPPPKEVTTRHEVDLRPPPEDPEPIILANDPSEAKPAQPDAPQPVVSPEPPAVIVDKGFTMDPPKITVNMNSDVREIIPPTSPGVIGGTGDKFNWGDITGLVGLDRTPATRLQVSPMYPYEAKKNGLTGQVVVDFVVDERGDVVQAKVVSSSDRVFEEPSIRAIMKWKFEPGKRSGRVVPFRMAIPLHFSLND